MPQKINVLVLLPLLIPMLTAVFSILFWHHRRVLRLLNVAGGALLLTAALALLHSVWTNGIQVMQMGAWPAPFGITFAVDLLSAVMVVIAGLMGFAVGVYSLGSMPSRYETSGYYALLHFLLMGVCGAFLTGDLFNMYVWFEIMLVSSFVLLALGRERAQLEGAIKYVTLNLLSSILFLSALGLLYGVAGTLNLADLAVHLRQNPRPGLVTALGVLFLMSFGIKAAIFPLFFWLPASYHTPPVSVSAIFAGLLTKVGVYAMIRVFTLLFVGDVAYTHTLILVIAGLTMITGVLGAVAQNEFRRILSVHIVSQIGYIIMGLGLFTPLALAGSVYFLLHITIVKTSLFLISGLVERLRGTCRLKKLGGFYRSHPWIALLFMVSAMSLAGVPPLSGFWAKLILIKAGLGKGGYVIVAAALGVSLLTLFSMMKIWNEVFWKAEPESAGEPQDVSRQPLTGASAFFYLMPIVLLITLSVGLGLGSQPFFELAQRAAGQLLDPAAYIQAVLGGGH